MKNMKAYYSVLLIAFLFATASAQFDTIAGNANTTALKELITESERNLDSLDSYRFTLSQDQRIETINLTDGNTTYEARVFALGSGAFNLTQRATKVVTATLSYPVGLEENATAVATEVYVLNDTLYSKVDGNWTAMKLSLPESVWTMQDRLNRSGELTNASEVRLLGNVIMDGEGVYVVEVIPESGAVSSLISQQLGAGFSISSIDLGALFNNTQLRYILWISMDSHIPVAEYVQMNMTLNPGMLGLSGRGDVEDHIDSIITLKLLGFNKPVNIVLPEQARRAEVLQLNNTQISPMNITQISPINTTQMTPLNNTQVLSILSSDNTQISQSGPATPQGDPLQYTVLYTNRSAPSTEMQQQLWLAEAYAFLYGGYNFYNRPLYTSSNMPYYTGFYYPYNIPYYSPYPVTYIPYTPASQGYATIGRGYTATPTPGYTIMTASNSSTGTYLTDGRGMTLYHLVSDQGSYTSKCTDATCTGIWPPFYAGSINVPANLNPADFRTITVNGYKQYQQTTYKGWPLYYYYRDTMPGNVYGQGISDSYGVWSVVNPEIPNTFPTQQPSTITVSPSPPAYITPSLYPPMPTPRPVTAPVSGNVPVTISYSGLGPFDVYLDGSYVGTGTGGSFSFSAPAGTHNMRIWDGSWDYARSVQFESGLPKIIYVEAV